MSDDPWLEALQILAKLGALPKQVLDKISGAIGAIYEPTHIRRIANAKADEIRAIAGGI